MTTAGTSHPIGTKSARISHAIKLRVWETHIGARLRAQCACCDANINVLDFVCGQIISAQNGGTVTVANLRPVCAACGEFMRTRDLSEARKFACPSCITTKSVAEFRFPVTLASLRVHDGINSPIPPTPFSTPVASDTSSHGSPDETTPLVHRRSKSVPKLIRAEVWDTYMGDVPRGFCPDCKKNIILRNKFKCKRVIDGGAIIVTNLRPVCSSCMSRGKPRPTGTKIALEKWATPQILLLCDILGIVPRAPDRAACIEQICARNYVLPRAVAYPNGDEARALIADIESRALLRALFGGAKRANLGMLKRFALVQIGVLP